MRNGIGLLPQGISYGADAAKPVYEGRMIHTPNLGPPVLSVKDYPSLAKAERFRQNRPMPRRPSSSAAGQPKKKGLPNPAWQPVGRRMRAAREVWGLSQTAAAKASRVDQAQLSKWELGKELPDLLRLAEYALKNRVSMDFLTYGIPSRVHPDALVALGRMAAKDSSLVILPIDTEPGTDRAQA